MPLAIVNTGDVSFSVGHIEQVHITADGRLFANSLTIIDLGLVVATAAQEVCPTWIKRQRPHRMSIERFEILEWLQVSIHGCKVPYLHPVVESTSDHLCPFSIYAKCLN